MTAHDNSEKLIRTYLSAKTTMYAAQVVYRTLFTLGLTRMFGYSFEQTVLILSFQQIIAMFLEVPTGIVGDCIGRKRAFMVSNFLSVAGYLLTAITSLFPSFAFIGVISLLLATSVAWTFQSGALEAWLTHNLKLQNHGREFHQIFGTREALRSAAALFLGPLFIFLFYQSFPLPWLIAAFLHFLSNLSLWSMTKNLPDHEVGKGKWPSSHLLMQKMKEVIAVSYASLRMQSILRAWIAIGAALGIIIVALAQFYPLWLDRFPTTISFGNFQVTKAWLISSTWIFFLLTRFGANLLVRRYSLQKDRFFLRYLFFVLMTFLPFLFFFHPLSLEFGATSLALFILTLSFVGLGSEFVEVIAEGQFSQEILNHDVRNTLHSVYSLTLEGSAGLVLLIWSLFPFAKVGPALLFKVVPFIAFPFVVYGIVVIFREKFACGVANEKESFETNS